MTTSHLLRRSIVFDLNCLENSYMKLSEITNRSHRGAYLSGQKAKREGLPRITPYKGNYPSRPYMDKHWYAGYDNEAKKAP